MILHKSWKFSLCFVLFFNKISLEIMSHDHLVRKQAFLDYKKWILHSCNIINDVLMIIEIENKPS